LTLAERPIGEDLTPRMQKRLYRTVVAAVSYPAKQPGYAIVLGFGRDLVHEPWKAYVLDECHSEDTYELIRACCTFDYKWSPIQWYGMADDSADQITWEVTRKYAEANKNWRGLSICPTMLAEYKQPYKYLLQRVKDMVNPKKRRLFLKNAVCKNYLMGIAPMEIPAMKYGDVPAIEAMAWAAIEGFRIHESEVAPDHSKWQEKPSAMWC